MKQEKAMEQLLADLEVLHKQVAKLKVAAVRSKELEYALRESEAKYHFLFDHMINGSAYQKILIDKNNQPIDYVFLEVNESFERLTGIKKADAINKKATEILPGIEKSRFDWIGAFGKVALTGEAIRFENYLEPLRRWYDVFAYSTEKGYFITTFNDITDRKQIEERSREQLHFLQTLIDTMPAPIFFKNAKGIYQGCNNAFADIVGMNKNDVIGKNVYEVNPKELADIYYQMDNNLLTNHGAQIYELQIYFADGTKHNVIFHKAAYEDIAGSLGGLVGIIIDVTESKHAESKLAESYQKLEKNLLQTVQSLSSLAELRDPYIAGHQVRVANIACAIASEMCLSQAASKILRTAALVHDIGKTTIPTEILNKPGTLSNIERIFIQTHAQASYEILKTIEFGYPIAEIVQQHHERLDGSGYPGGLSKCNILFASRILAVADVVEAMASHRPYRPALPLEQAINEIERNKGSLYDPEVVDACLSLYHNERFQLSSTLHYS
ncbi:MAG: HD domain-containing phosphohydrolase [Thermacetogeniaceae bacterium]